MFKRIILVPAIIAALCILASLPLLAQSQQDAIRLHQEADELREKAKSNEDLENALQKYEAALVIYQKVGDSENGGLAHNSVGLICAGWGQYAKAVEHYKESLELSRKLEDLKWEGQILNNLGVLYKDWGQYSEAVECYEKSVVLKRKIGDLKGIAATLNNLGNVFRDWGQFSEAVEYYAALKSQNFSREIARENRDLWVYVWHQQIIFSRS
ncbi:MAG: tetratricopeptide repeat protein, partial [Deltaproteobacteria bacterium]|nr:tetratricopeptide repeat protein [Deltaproteobacteria bacterium]